MHGMVPNGPHHTASAPLSQENDSPSPEQESPHFLSEVKEGELLYPDEPPRFTKRDIEPFFVWAFEQGTSDITIQTAENIILEIHGKKRRVTRRKLTQAEIMDMVVALFESTSATGSLAGVTALDFAYVARPDRAGRYRFRVNATAMDHDGARGVQITARTITSKPPTFDDLNIEEEIRRAFDPDEGLILVTGATGSGKSTLLSAGIRGLVEDPDANLKVITYESPIEYVYDEIEKPTSVVSQHEIGKHLPSFVEAVRNALRRAPDIILLGEMRDAETIGEGITAAMTGHLVYSTVHSSGFADTIRRMVNAFPSGERNARAVDIISNLRMVISQRLVPATDGRRVALREYVVFNEEIVDLLLDGGLEQLTASCRKVLRTHGRSFLVDAREKLAAGRISRKVFEAVARGAKGEQADAIQQTARVQRQATAVAPASTWRSDLSLPDEGAGLADPAVSPHDPSSDEEQEQPS